MRANKLYFLINGLGIVINVVALVIIVSILDFESKSFISVVFWSFIGYGIKSWLFTIPILKMKQFDDQAMVNYKVLYCLLPFLFALLWYAIIIGFKMESLYFDFSFGYFQRFPHGLIQLATLFFNEYPIINHKHEKKYQCISY